MSEKPATCWLISYRAALAVLRADAPRHDVHGFLPWVEDAEQDLLTCVSFSPQVTLARWATEYKAMKRRADAGERPGLDIKVRRVTRVYSITPVNADVERTMMSVYGEGQ